MIINDKYLTMQCSARSSSSSSSSSSRSSIDRNRVSSHAVNNYLNPIRFVQDMFPLNHSTHYDHDSTTYNNNNNNNNNNKRIHMTHNLEFTHCGQGLLAHSENGLLYLYNVKNKPEEEEEEEEEDCVTDESESTEKKKKKKKNVFKVPKSTYDVKFYPGAHREIKETMIVICASKDNGVKMLDVSSSSSSSIAEKSLRMAREKSQYFEKNRNDELVGSISCSFTGNGGKILGGKREKGICVWNADRPGCDFQDVGFNTQSKLTSCFAVGNEQNNGIDCANVFAAGSYGDGNAICLYDLRNGYNGNDCCVLAIENPHKYDAVSNKNCGGGITCLKFSMDGNGLFSSARKSNSILCWDLRKAVKAENFMEGMQRPNRSNAKTKFDIEPCGKHLVAGGDDGILRCFNLRENGKEVFAFKASDDAVAAFQFHPLASSLKETSTINGSNDRKEEEEEEDLCMNDVALGASVSGERSYNQNITSNRQRSISTSSDDSISVSTSTKEKDDINEEQSAMRRTNVLTIWRWNRRLESF